MKHKSHSDGQTCTSEADENNNKPLPDGGAALPTSETGQRRRVGIKKEKEKKKKIVKFKLGLLLDNTLKSSQTRTTV